MRAAQVGEKKQSEGHTAAVGDDSESVSTPTASMPHRSQRSPNTQYRQEARDADMDQQPMAARTRSAASEGLNGDALGLQDESRGGERLQL
jgi:hypothetical protein